MQCESGLEGKRLEFINREFVRILGMDRFAFTEFEPVAGYGDELVAGADQIYLDAPLLFIVKG